MDVNSAALASQDITIRSAFNSLNASDPPGKAERVHWSIDDPAALLSLTNCREILGADSANISDAEMEALRGQLYYLATVTINTLQTNRGSSNAFSTLRLSLNQCLADTCIEVEERAAVMEFDGKLSRDEAERAAIAGAVKDWNN